MHKSNTNSEKIFDNNDEDIKTIEKLLQVKLSDSSIILYLHQRSCYSSIFQCKKLEMYRRSLKKDDKLTP